MRTSTLLVIFSLLSSQNGYYYCQTVKLARTVLNKDGKFIIFLKLIDRTTFLENVETAQDSLKGFHLVVIFLKIL